MTDPFAHIPDEAKHIFDGVSIIAAFGALMSWLPSISLPSVDCVDGPEVSIKIGLVLTDISSIAPQYMSVDSRIGYAGAAAGVLLVIWKEG